MASLYQRGKTFWVSYYLDGRLVQQSLRTDNERVARSKLKRISEARRLPWFDILLLMDSTAPISPTSGFSHACNPGVSQACRRVLDCRILPRFAAFCRAGGARYLPKWQ
jgi:hypothetical protein